MFGNPRGLLHLKRRQNAVAISKTPAG